MSDDPVLAALLPRITQLSTVLSRGRVVERAVAAAGIDLDRPALSVLITLHTAGGPLRVGEIAARMQVVGPHVTRQVNELERRGLVHRVADPADQRARLVELAPEGADAVGRYLREVLGWFSGAMAGWSETDRADLTRLLGRMVDDLTAQVDDEPA
ncbi:MarR family transcriptional regulator [Pseudonocardia sp. DR1-2]|uniref:MarR family winged helix-turn-helix transcriptional regulator n=1 Tax=Pseudonocardia sp. DR1-2 TaxID=2951168 RepID=UPI00204480A3|nr:MarR family transcriptional regulator [Pseudonocardia sp. DR1-2]MCM3848173.1 MarR family transcriptional regulator [Pseudonocardia sp. DR1-2]